MLRRDDDAISHLMIIVIVAVVLIVLMAVLVMAWAARDVTDGGSAPRDTVAVIAIKCKIGDIDNQIAQIEVRDVSFKVTVQDYDSSDDSWPDLGSLHLANLFYAGGEFEVTLKVTVKGPNDFLEDGLQQTQKIQLDEWDFGKRSLSFQTMRCRVPQNGDYWVYAEIVVTGDDEGVENEIAWTKNKLVEVSGYS